MSISGLGDTDYTMRYRLRDRASQQAPAMTLQAPQVEIAGAGLEPPSISSSLSSALFALGTGESSRSNIYEKTTDSGQSSDLDLLAELEKWSRMNVAEKIRAQYLESKGLSEEALAELPPEERQLIEDEIAAAIQRSLTGIESGDSTGAAQVAQAGADTGRDSATA